VDKLINNGMTISDRTLLFTCTGISLLSFCGVIFLVVVVSLVVSKAVALAERYSTLKTQLKEKGQHIVDSEGFKNFQDHLIDATENALNSTKHVTETLGSSTVRRSAQTVVKEDDEHHPMTHTSFAQTVRRSENNV